MKKTLIASTAAIALIFGISAATTARADSATYTGVRLSCLGSQARFGYGPTENCLLKLEANDGKTASCRATLNFDALGKMSDVAQLTPAQKSSLANASRLRMISTERVPTKTQTQTVSIVNGVRTVTPLATPIVTPGYTSYVFDLCLDSGYVSNLPAGLDAARILALNATSTYAVRVPLADAATAGLATSTTSYSVSVNYDKFTAEASQYGYTSVYTTTGTKTVSISVIKLAAGSSLTAAQAISQLSAMGYRPATLSELYSLKQSQSGSVNSTTVALGTNLGGAYGYPTGSGTGASGLGRSSGPFSTTSWKFVGVRK